MLVKVGALAKAFPTLAALVGLLAGVDPLVQLEGRLAPEAVAALPAGVGPLSRVHPLVSLQLRVPREALPTVVAPVGLPGRAGRRVAEPWQAAAQASSASFALLQLPQRVRL